MSREAADILSSPTKRHAYDVTVEKRKKRRWSYLVKGVKDLIHNAQSLLRAKRSLTELEELKTILHTIDEGVCDFFEKVKYAPTLIDKVLWIRDAVKDNKVPVILVIIFLGIVT